MAESDSTISFVRDTSGVVAGQALGAATSLIEYRAGSECLIIGDPEQAFELADQLEPLKITVAAVQEAGHESANGSEAALNSVEKNGVEKKLTESGIKVFFCSTLELQGYLGQYSASTVSADGSRVQLGVLALTETGYFDVVLDLSEQPLIGAALAPFGYYHVTDDESRERCLAEMPELVGEFEKPKYFNHNTSICAHERSLVSGCNNCIEVCSTGAISHGVDSVTIDPYLCQGCGHCSSVCPSGAISFAYPKPADAIAKTRDLLGAADVRPTVLVLYKQTEDEAQDDSAQEGGANEGKDAPDQSAVDLEFEQSMPVHVQALAVEEVGAFGIDYWLSVIASGVQKIVLLSESTTQKSVNGENNVLPAISLQLEIAHRMLSGLGLPDGMVESVERTDKEGLSQALQLPVDVPQPAQMASFATHNDKRQTIRLAMDHLVDHLATPPVEPQVSLPQGSPFGALLINQDACTLCLACVSTCPAGALADGQDLPQLRFIQSNCVQCGICASACPEEALSLEPQYLYDSLKAREAVVLHEETPFNCVTCHKPFATRKMIDTMSAKLSGHWMFEDEKAIRRLKMCEDCRVKDMFQDGGEGIKVHRDA